MATVDPQFKVTRILRQRLIEDAELSALIADRVFPIVAPIDTEGDFIIYRRDTYKKERTQMGVSSQQVGVFITVISDNYDRSVDMIFLVHNILEGEYNGLTVELEDAYEDFEIKEETSTGKFKQEILFTIN